MNRFVWPRLHQGTHRREVLPLVHEDVVEQPPVLGSQVFAATLATSGKSRVPRARDIARYCSMTAHTAALCCRLREPPLPPAGHTQVRLLVGDLPRQDHHCVPGREEGGAPQILWQLLPSGRDGVGTGVTIRASGCVDRDSAQNCLHSAARAVEPRSTTHVGVQVISRPTAARAGPGARGHDDPYAWRR